MCLQFHKIFRAAGQKSPFEGRYGVGAGAGLTAADGQEPQADDDRGYRRYRRRRRMARGGEDWRDLSPEERRARRQERQAARSDDLRIPEPDINDPNPTPEGGINY